MGDPSLQCSINFSSALLPPHRKKSELSQQTGECEEEREGKIETPRPPTPGQTPQTARKGVEEARGAGRVGEGIQPLLGDISQTRTRLVGRRIYALCQVNLSRAHYGSRQRQGSRTLNEGVGGGGRQGGGGRGNREWWGDTRRSVMEIK